MLCWRCIEFGLDDNFNLSLGWNHDLLMVYEHARDEEGEYMMQQMEVHQNVTDNWEWDNWS